MAERSGSGSPSAGRRAPTFALYRIIGNDLPPRHVPGQHLRNLAFVLEHEPALERCRKWWVLNRLADPGEERDLLDLLAEHGCDHLRLPFSLDEYAECGWRLDFDVPLFSRRFQKLSEKKQALLIEHTYHDKNRYVMNNNGARNTALAHGRSQADWVLPWDGNCFVPEPAWRELLGVVDARPDLSYVVVPMARVGDEEVRHHDTAWRPEATDEPQIAFAADAPEQFDEDLRYGRNPKAALLRALGVPGIWNERAHEPWEPGLPEPGSARGEHVEASWVVRLTSGRADLEQQPGQRVRQRREAIARKLDGLDERVARLAFAAEAPFAWDADRLEKQRTAWRTGHAPMVRVVRDLCAAIEQPPGGPEPANGVILGALAWWFTGHDPLARGAVEHLDRLLASAATEVMPSTVMNGEKPEPIALIHVAEAVRLLETSGVLGAGLRARTREWFAGLLQSLLAARATEKVAQRADHHGLWFEALTLAAAALVDDVPTLTTTHRRVCSRLQTQIGESGEPVGELDGPCSQDASASALLAWLTLARMTARFGADLSGADGNGRGVVDVLRWFLQASTGPWPWRQRLPHDLDVSDAVRLRAAWQYPRHVDPSSVPDPGVAYRIKQWVAPGTGLRPFWALGE